MKISEYKKFIVKELTKIEAEHGDLPVVMWSHEGMVLDEEFTTELRVRKEPYTAWNKGDRVVLVLGPDYS